MRPKEAAETREKEGRGERDNDERGGVIYVYTGEV